MADKTIAELTALVTPAGADVLPIVSGGATKKVTVDDLVAASARGVKVGTGASTPTLDKVLIGTGTGTSAWGNPPDSAAVAALEDKVGTGASTPVLGQALIGTDTGESAWRDLPYYNAKDHGVMGDGVTDNTAALNALITLVSAANHVVDPRGYWTAGGGTIIFPAGIYLVGTINLANNVKLQGVSGASANTAFTTRFLHANGTNGPMFFVDKTVYGVGFADFAMDGNKGNNRTGDHHGIQFEDAADDWANWGQGAPYPQIDHLYIAYFRLNGIDIGTPFLTTHVNRCQILNCDQDGIRLGTSDSRIFSCSIGEHGRYGINVEVGGNHISQTDVWGCLRAINVATGAVGGPPDGLLVDSGIFGWNQQENIYIGAGVKNTKWIGCAIRESSWSAHGVYSHVVDASNSATHSFVGCHFEATSGGTAVNAHQCVTVDATAGTFTLTLDGQTTAAIAFNASAPVMLAAMAALSNVADLVAGACADLNVWMDGLAYVLTFKGAWANTSIAAITANTGLLTGTAVVRVIKQGGASPHAKYDYSITGGAALYESGSTRRRDYVTALTDQPTLLQTSLNANSYMDQVTQHLLGAGGAGAPLSSYGAYSAGPAAPTIEFHKSRDATIYHHDVVHAWDLLSSFLSYGSDGSTFRLGAHIYAQVSATPSGDMPTDVVIATTPVGSYTPSEALRVNHQQRLILGGVYGPQIINGTGSPESAITAPQGSMYVQTDGDSGRAVWFHVGSGDTGWESYTGHGTSFPADPYTGMRFYRSDRRMEYFYDGTLWLSTELFNLMLDPTGAVTHAATGAARVSVLDPNGVDKWCERITLEFAVSSGGTALDGSNSWIVLVAKEQDGAALGAGTNLATYTIDDGTSGYLRHATSDGTTTTAVNALLGADYPILKSTFTKLGVPGALTLMATLEYRLVG